ncbi:MAG: hypothetical protein ACI857_001903 [Arenicella sp.]|jgi:hypothetical protein
MKNGMIILALLFMSFSCTSNSEANAEERRTDYAEFIDNPTEMSFEEMDYDFGEVTEGKQVKYTFKFKNTGDQNLILINVKGSCGCTVPEEWPKNPIAPGETGEIKVSFDSQGRVGNVRKNVRVEANTNPSLNILTITGIVNE